VFFEVHHFRKKLPVREGRGGKSDCGGLHSKQAGCNAPAFLNGLEAGFPESTTGLLRLLMCRAERESIDVPPASLTKDGNDIVAKNLPDSFSSGSREVGAGKFTGVGNNDRMGGVFKKYGERFAGP
tara:strand:- start:58 stop:435 length:378 start_codon:yes stop_codon:yes gene_type:complete